MQTTPDQPTELAPLQAELRKAEARIVSAFDDIPEGHALEGEPLERFTEAEHEVRELKARIKEITAKK